MNTTNALKSFEQQVNDIITGAVELDEFEHEARSQLGRINLESWEYSYSVGPARIVSAGRSSSTGLTGKYVRTG